MHWIELRRLSNVHTLASQLATLSACMQFGLNFGAAVAPQDAPTGIAAAYVLLVPTGCVVETTTNLLRYFKCLLWLQNNVVQIKQMSANWRFTAL